MRDNPAEAPPSVSGYFNVACGDRISLLELVTALNQCLDTDFRPQHEPARVGDVRDSQADIAKVQAALGFAPTVSFADGLARTVAYFRQITVVPA